MKKNLGEKLFQIFNIILLTSVIATIVFPCMNIVSLSLSNRDSILSRNVSIWPKGFNFKAYLHILQEPTFLRSIFNTVLITIIAAPISSMLTLMVGYAMTKKFPGRKIITYYFVLTMYFSGGLIPTFIVITKYLKLQNTYWVLILPYLVNTFYIIVMRSQIENIPSSIFESAYLDGAGEYTIVFRILLPTILPTIAAISMFFALAYWNTWFPVLVYIDTNKMWTLQYFLRVVIFDKIIQARDTSVAVEIEQQIPEENFRMAAIVLVSLPIVAIYPFVQKHFVKGIISGAVKG